MANDSVVDERTLRELYLTNFEIAIREGQPKTLMTSYNAVNGTYAHENQHLLSDILRGEWGYRGTVVSDWGGCNDFVESVRAGANLEMPGTGDDSPTQLYQAVKDGRITEAEIDARVDELLALVFDVSLAEKPEADLEAQHLIALEAAEKSIVLLKNEGNILPLKREMKIALIGDFAEVRLQGKRILHCSIWDSRKSLNRKAWTDRICGSLTIRFVCWKRWKRPIPIPLWSSPAEAPWRCRGFPTAVHSCGPVWAARHRQRLS